VRFSFDHESVTLWEYSDSALGVRAASASRHPIFGTCCRFLPPHLKNSNVSREQFKSSLILGSLCKPTLKRRLWELCLSGALQILDLIDLIEYLPWYDSDREEGCMQWLKWARTHRNWNTGPPISQTLARSLWNKIYEVRLFFPLPRRQCFVAVSLCVYAKYLKSYELILMIFLERCIVAQAIIS